MKIEKVNENQIRCTLTREDLASRQIKLSELAYGTEKAKNLFRDMMQQAHFQFGFEAEDIPLMIEAIPLNQDCIVLIITKVEDPEELDTRFSRFAPSVEEAVEAELEKSLPNPPLDLYMESSAPAKPKEDTAVEKERVFLFTSLEKVLDAALLVSSADEVDSYLYKGSKEAEYFLLLSGELKTTETFNKICNLLSEYGSFCREKGCDSAYLNEYCELLLSNNALVRLQASAE